MLPPTRSRSLRQPRYTHHDLIADGQQPAIISKQVLKPKLSAGTANPQEHGTLDYAVARSNDEAQESSVNLEVRSEIKREQNVRRCASHRTSSTMFAEGRKSHLPRVGRNRDDMAAVGKPSSSGLPPLSQAPRPPSRGKATGLVKGGDAGKGFPSRTASVTGTFTGNSSLRASIASPPEPQEDFLARVQLIPPLKQVPPGSEPPRRRKQSTVGLPEPGPAKASARTQSNFNAIGRPPFSTFQQRFSPVKQRELTEATKVISRSSHPDTDANHFTAVQDEMLQLQLMYMSSRQTLQKWTKSGEDNIIQQQRKLVQEASEVRTIEHNQQECINGAALKDWLLLGKGLTRVESLAQCVQTLADLTQSDQRLSRVIEQFEAWYENTSEVLNERSGGSQRLNPRFLQPLGQLWAETVTALIHSFETCLGKLEELGPGDGLSGLGLVMDAHTRFSKGILDELNTMKVVHAMALEQEDDWIRSKVSALLAMDNEPGGSPCSPKCSAAWKRTL